MTGTTPTDVEPRRPQPVAARCWTGRWIGRRIWRWIARAGSLVRLWINRTRERNELRSLDARQLRDVGLDPEAVRREAAKPFWWA